MKKSKRYENTFSGKVSSVYNFSVSHPVLGFPLTLVRPLHRLFMFQKTLENDITSEIKIRCKNFFQTSFPDAKRLEKMLIDNNSCKGGTQDGYSVLQIQKKSLLDGEDGFVFQYRGGSPFCNISELEAAYNTLCKKMQKRIKGCKLKQDGKERCLQNFKKYGEKYVEVPFTKYIATVAYRYFSVASEIHEKHKQGGICKQLAREISFFSLGSERSHSPLAKAFVDMFMHWYSVDMKASTNRQYERDFPVDSFEIDPGSSGPEIITKSNNGTVETKYVSFERASRQLCSNLQDAADRFGEKRPYEKDRGERVYCLRAAYNGLATAIKRHHNKTFDTNSFS